MEKLIINGGTPLQGSVTISGAKTVPLPWFLLRCWQTGRL